MSIAKRKRYSGPAFTKMAYARKRNVTGDEDQDSAPYSEFWDADGPGGILSMDEAQWVATYKLVRVQKLKRTVKVVRAR